jgi:hypothetical protein
MEAPPISLMTLRFFRRIVRGYFRRHFHAIRVSQVERFSALAKSNAGPVIVYANHSSWWDPMVSVYLAERLMDARQHYAPMDAAALERYAILKRVGIFGIETNSARGAVKFLKTSESILIAGGVVWITPQGRFVDSRVRPLEFKPGLSVRLGITSSCKDWAVLRSSPRDRVSILGRAVAGMFAALRRASKGRVTAGFGNVATTAGEIAGDRDEYFERDSHATRCPKLRNLIVWKVRYWRIL